VANQTPQSILIRGGKHYDNRWELDGTLTLRRSRYLHVDADLWLTEFGQVLAQNSLNTLPSGISPDLLEKYPGLAEWQSSRGTYMPTLTHRLQESRRMRSSTLHFLDHPAFGVLIQIDGYEVPVSDTESP